MASPADSHPMEAIGSALEYRRTLKGITNEVQSFFRGREVITEKDTKELSALIAKVEGLIKKDEGYDVLKYLHKDLSDIQKQLKIIPEAEGAVAHVKVNNVAAEIMKSIDITELTAGADEISRLRKLTIPSTYEFGHLDWKDVPWYQPGLNDVIANSFLMRMPIGTYLVCSPRDIGMNCNILCVRTENGVEKAYADTKHDLVKLINNSPSKYTYPLLNTPSFDAKATTRALAETKLKEGKQPFMLRESSIAGLFALSFPRGALIDHVLVRFEPFGWRALDGQQNPKNGNFYSTVEDLFNAEYAGIAKRIEGEAKGQKDKA